ncbi:vWA domain-containing protein [Actinophytocola sediminis]
MDATGAKLLPFYVVVDVSYSMSGKKLASANQILPRVRDALAENPILSDKVRIGLIDFSSDAQVRLPLCDLLDPGLTLPRLSVRDGTSYVAAFSLLHTEIATNIKQLKADGFQVHRPAVFFLSDGEPNETDPEWQAAFATLTGVAAYPNVIPFGVDKADGATLARLVHPSTGAKQMRMYLMENGQDPAQAINTMAEIMVSSVISSGRSISQGETGILFPDKDDLGQGVTAHTASDWV